LTGNFSCLWLIFDQPEIGFVSGVFGEHIENEMFLDHLFHQVEQTGFGLPLGPVRPKSSSVFPLEAEEDYKPEATTFTKKIPWSAKERRVCLHIYNQRPSRTAIHFP